MVKLQRARVNRVFFALGGILALAGAVTAQEPVPLRPEIQVEVLEDAWSIGDEKTYTLLFDRAPLGRQALRLVALRRLPGGAEEAVFRQRITLDLRALGQTGTLEHSGTVRYRGRNAGPYHYREGLLTKNGYATYRKQRDYENLVEVQLDPEAGTYRIGTPGTEEVTEAALPASARAILVDLLVLGHWERVFESRSSWPLGESLPQSLLIPSPLPRFDFHLPVTGPRAVSPVVAETRITVEAREPIEIFGAQVDTFRCRIEPTGLVLWVSPHGGVLRFDDGKGLSGSLEP